MTIILTDAKKGQLRNQSPGDWIVHGSDGSMTILAARELPKDYRFLIQIHELVECYLCTKRGITDKAVTEFDAAFEGARQPGNLDEPGHDPAAPYRNEHNFAEIIERLMAKELGVDWNQYAAAVDALIAPVNPGTDSNLQNRMNITPAIIPTKSSEALTAENMPAFPRIHIESPELNRILRLGYEVYYADIVGSGGVTIGLNRKP